MPVTTLSSRDVNHDIGRAKRAAKDGPVLITDRGRPAHVLLTYADYQKLVGGAPTIRAMLDQPGMEDIEVEFPRLGRGLFRPADLG